MPRPISRSPKLSTTSHIAGYLLNFFRASFKLLCFISITKWQSLRVTYTRRNLTFPQLDMGFKEKLVAGKRPRSVKKRSAKLATCFRTDPMPDQLLTTEIRGMMTKLDEPLWWSNVGKTLPTQGTSLSDWRPRQGSNLRPAV